MTQIYLMASFVQHLLILSLRPKISNRFRSINFFRSIYDTPIIAVKSEIVLIIGRSHVTDRIHRRPILGEKADGTISPIIHNFRWQIS